MANAAEPTAAPMLNDSSPIDPSPIDPALNETIVPTLTESLVATSDDDDGVATWAVVVFLTLAVCCCIVSVALAVMYTRRQTAAAKKEEEEQEQTELHPEPIQPPSPEVIQTPKPDDTEHLFGDGLTSNLLGNQLSTPYGVTPEGPYSPFTNHATVMSSPPVASFSVLTGRKPPPPVTASSPPKSVSFSFGSSPLLPTVHDPFSTLGSSLVELNETAMGFTPESAYCYTGSKDGGVGGFAKAAEHAIKKCVKKASTHETDFDGKDVGEWEREVALCMEVERSAAGVGLARLVGEEVLCMFLFAFRESSFSPFRSSLRAAPSVFRVVECKKVKGVFDSHLSYLTPHSSVLCWPAPVVVVSEDPTLALGLLTDKILILFHIHNARVFLCNTGDLLLPSFAKLSVTAVSRMGSHLVVSLTHLEREAKNQLDSSGYSPHSSVKLR